MADGFAGVGNSDLSQWLGDRSFEEARQEFDEKGYLIFERVLPEAALKTIHAALEPEFQKNLIGRNNFEGLKSNRAYALMGKSPVFVDLVLHPLVLPFVDADLGSNCLLSACLAINLHPGETVQPWHFDDSHYRISRPRQSLGVSAFWAIDDMTETNGATEIIPGSHTWSENSIDGASSEADFANTIIGDPEDDPGERDDAMKVIMPAGSLMLAKGTLWHRGGANKSDGNRLLITPQYCPGWTRQLENMALAIPPEKVREMPKRAQELIGYSIHAPFMGYVDGMHPARTLGQTG